MAKQTTRKTPRTRMLADGDSLVDAETMIEETQEEPEEEMTPAPIAVVPKAQEVPKGYLVELLEGSSYEVRGTVFLKNRPIVVVDKKVLDAVLQNARFKTSAVGG